MGGPADFGDASSSSHNTTKAPVTPETPNPLKPEPRAPNPEPRTRPSTLGVSPCLLLLFVSSALCSLCKRASFAVRDYACIQGSSWPMGASMRGRGCVVGATLGEFGEGVVWL